jgi:hypothetical protein
MGDTLQVNDSSMQALAAYLQKTLEPTTRHEGMSFSHFLHMGTSRVILDPFATKKNVLNPVNHQNH